MVTDGDMSHFVVDGGRVRLASVIHAGYAKGDASLRHVFTLKVIFLELILLHSSSFRFLVRDL